MDLLEGRAVVALANHELLPALDDIDAEINRLEGIRLQIVARAEDSGYAQELGARDTVDLLAFRYRRDRADVWREVRLARALPKYGAVADGIADGAVRTAQAAGIVAELERVRTRVPVEDLDVAETQLVGLAAHLAPTDLRSAAKRICNLIDSDGPEPEENKAYDRETLTLSRADNGVKFKGFLANENAELLRSVIHAGSRPHKTKDGELDPRPRDKRQADALTTALTLAANAWDTNTATPNPATGTDDGSTGGAGAPCSGRAIPGHGAKANITVTIDLEDLRAATANAVGQTVYGDDLSAATIRRLACDANIIPLVLGANSQPLDVGRSERLVTRHIRQALIARDQGCVICGAPPIMTDAHHLIHWKDGGPTAIWNLALLRLSRESSGPGVGGVFGGPGVLPLPVRRGWL
ncbi:HNH endonuclease, partial [Kribbella jejuensis]